MTSSARVPLCVAAIALCISAFSMAGCESCRPSEEPEKAERPSPAKAAAPAAPAQEEADCFVIVDAEADFGAPPLTVEFVTEVECTATPVTYAWDFGDGTKGGNEPNPTHVYKKPGDYLAVVTASSPDGGRGSDEIDITVDELFEEEE